MRFKVGELAIIAVDIDGNGHDGKIVEIISVGPMPVRTKSHPGEVWMADYQVELDGADNWYVKDIELRKINDPGEELSDEEELEEELSC
jgi:hypothetical protein